MAPKKEPKKAAAKKVAKKVYDYSGLEEGMSVKVESSGTYYASKVLTVSTSKNRSKAPVKISYNGYDGYDEWVGGDRLRSKALKVSTPEVEKKEPAPAKDPPFMVYFPLAGRGELIRLIAAGGGVKLTESTEMPEGETKDMYLTPSGVPVFKHGSLKMSQSTAIESYMVGLSPKFRRLTLQQKAIDSMYACIKEEMLGGAAKAIFTTIKTDKEQAIKDITALYDKWFDLIEAKVPEEGFILGKKFPTVADLCLVNITMGYMPYGAAAKHAGYDFAKYPKVMKIVEAAKKADGVAAYLESTTSMAGNPFGM